MIPFNVFAIRDHCASCDRRAAMRNRLGDAATPQQTVIRCHYCNSTRCEKCCIDACRNCGWPCCNLCRHIDDHPCERDSILGRYPQLVCRAEGCYRPQKMGLGIVYCELCNQRECLAGNRCIASIHSAACPCCSNKDVCGECASWKVRGSRVKTILLPNGLRVVTPRVSYGWCCHNYMPRVR